MLCRNPYVSITGVAHGCGQCHPCRFNRRRIWTHRIMLESVQYADNAFVTLTYSDAKLPLTKVSTQSPVSLPTLSPTHLQTWMKRLRSAYPHRVRFFAVGEYGDQTERPHYHAALFNYPSCRHGRTRVGRSSGCCSACDLVRNTWGHGEIFLGGLAVESAQYVAGYVTKKMTHRNDPRLNGRHPEFARMSLRPGIGADAMHEVASTLMQFNLEVSQGDVPSSLRHGSRQLPLGRYLRRRLRTLVGKEPNAPQITMDEIAAELLPVRLAARASEENPSIKARLIDSTKGKAAALESRSRIFKKRGSL